MNDQLVTVFGGSGFVGRHVVRLLAQQGYRLRVAVRHPHLAHFLRPMGRVGQIQIVYGDIKSEESITRAIQGADAVIDLVGILSEWGKQTFKALHAVAPGKIGEAAAKAGVKRVVHISAIGADRKSPARYGRTKAAGEEALKSAFAGATILRPSVVFGPEDTFFNRFGNMTRFFPLIPLIGGGKTRFQPVYAGDVAQAVAQVLARDDTAGRTYELGGPKIYTFRALLELILSETGRRNPLVPVPFLFASMKALFLGLLPNPVLTMDQVASLKRDNVVSGTGGTLADLGVTPTAVEAIVPSYLWRFRRNGQFETLPVA